MGTYGEVHAAALATVSTVGWAISGSPHREDVVLQGCLLVRHGTPQLWHRKNCLLRRERTLTGYSHEVKAKSVDPFEPLPKAWSTLRQPQHRHFSKRFMPEPAGKWKLSSHLSLESNRCHFLKSLRGGLVLSMHFVKDAIRTCKTCQCVLLDAILTQQGGGKHPAEVCGTLG